LKSFPYHNKADILKDVKAGEGPSKCTWKLGTKEKSPHMHLPLKPEPKILNSILDHVGNTPLVRCNKIPQSFGIECEVLAKCEFFNAGGSVKDRIGKRMIEDAEKSGRLKLGDTLIEPTSGNTGIGLALAAAIKGYRMIITLPEKMSQEKVDVLKALGAEIIRTPTEAAFDSPDSHIGVANRLNAEIKNSHILDQYSNPSNPLAHYDGTAEEILASCGTDIHTIVMSAGTGGTISGIARKLKEKIPNIRVVGVDPNGSILALPETLNGSITSYQVEGIGYDFIPTVLDRALIDQWVKTDDKESFIMSRRLIREEGLLCGGSAGSTFHAAMQVAKDMKKGQRLVVLLADSVRNYMTKFLNDGWMVENGFMPANDADSKVALQPWAKHTVSALSLQTPLTVTPTVTANKCITLLQKEGIDQLPVVDDDSSIKGVITLGNLSSHIFNGRIGTNDPIDSAIYKKFSKVGLNTTLAELSVKFNKDPFALVVNQQRHSNKDGDIVTRDVVFGVVTRIDLLNYITSLGGK